jgi:hypothetical protein
MQSMVMACCCPSGQTCCYSTLMCAVTNGVVTARYNYGGSSDLVFQAIGNATPAYTNGPECGAVGCTLSLTTVTHIQGTYITTNPATPNTEAPARWQLFSLRWNTLYNLCSILPPGSVHAGEINRDPRWVLKLTFSRAAALFDPAFTLDVFYRRLSETPPQFQCASLGVYEYETQYCTLDNFGLPIASMSTGSSVTLA